MQKSSLFFYKFLSSLFSILFLIPFSGNSSDYIWPTNASNLMTSSFCEFRPRHYHAAIDIKTWNRTGYRIFAIDDGYIMRVRVSAFGYGKAIYLKLNDGNIVVYAHLKRFMPSLEHFVTNKQQSREEYRVDIYFNKNQFPVEKGQILGYTGRTGIGVPHLHFEIRNPQNEPINPLQFYPHKIQDNLVPQLYELALIPFNQKSLVNFKQDTFFIDLQRHTKYSLPDTLFLTGKIGVALKAFDRANGATNLFSFYSAKMQLDDSLIYSVQYDMFSYAKSKLVELDKNFSLWRKQKGIFHNFYRHTENRLLHYQNTPKNGGILDCTKLKEGLHHLTISIFDYWNNMAEFDMYFLSGNPAFLEYDLNRIVDDNLFLRLQSSEGLEKITISRESNPNSWEPIHFLRLPVAFEHDNIYYYSFSETLKYSVENSILKVQGKNGAGYLTFPLYLFPSVTSKNNSSSRKFRVQSKKIHKDWITLKTEIQHQKPFYLLDNLKKETTGLFWFPLGPNLYQLNIPVATILSDHNLYKSLIGNELSDLKFYSKGNSTTLFSSDSLFRANFLSGSLYDESIIYIRVIDSLDNKLSIIPPYTGIGKIYDLQPFDQPVGDGVWISLAAPSSSLHNKGMGLYYWDQKKGWLFIPSQIDSIGMKYSARVTSLEKFTLVQDTIPPIIYPSQRAPNKRLHTQNGKLSFLLKDEMSGIQKESQMNVYLNGKWQLFEYDPEEDIISVTLPQKNLKRLQLLIKATDNAGNSTQASFIVN